MADASASDMVEALIARKHDPDVLAGLAPAGDHPGIPAASCGDGR